MTGQTTGQIADITGQSGQRSTGQDRTHPIGVSGCPELSVVLMSLFPWVSGISGNNRIQGTTESKPSSRFCCGKTATAAKDSEEYLK